MPSQVVLEEKSGEVKEIEKWLVEYKSIGVASLRKVRAPQLQELKKTMKGQVYLRVLKNTLFKIAIEEMNQAELKKLEEYLDHDARLPDVRVNPSLPSAFAEQMTFKRSIHASTGDDFADTARAAAIELRDTINRHRQTHFKSR